MHQTSLHFLTFQISLQSSHISLNEFQTRRLKRVGQYNDRTQAQIHNQSVIAVEANYRNYHYFPTMSSTGSRCSLHHICYLCEAASSKSQVFDRIVSDKVQFILTIIMQLFNKVKESTGLLRVGSLPINLTIVLSNEIGL